MKKLLFIIGVFICFQSFGQNRFPSVDSAKNYTLRYIRNSTVESFTNLRMQNVAYGTLELLDSISNSVFGAGVDSIWLSSSATKDTIKYSLSGTNYTAAVLDKASLRVAISDSAAMLAGYTRLTRFTDSLAAHTTRFNRLYDSLASHVTRADTTRNGIRGDLNSKLNITDTSNKWVTQVYRKTASDSVFYTKGGTNTFAFKDSTGGGGGGLADDSTNTFGNEIQMYGGVLRVTRSGSTNTWGMLEDGSHAQLGITSVTASGNVVTVNYHPGSKVITMMAVPDESMSSTMPTNAGTPYYNFGPYLIGARTFVNYAEFNISRLTNASYYVYYNGSAWVAGQSTIKGSIGPSPGWTMTWTAGRLRIESISVPFRKAPGVNMMAWGGSASNLKYVPGVNLISDVFVDIYFYDITTGAQYTDATPPTNFAVLLDLGVVATAVQVGTEDFGVTGSTNFWIFGLLKK